MLWSLKGKIAQKLTWKGNRNDFPLNSVKDIHKILFVFSDSDIK